MKTVILGFVPSPVAVNAPTSEKPRRHRRPLGREDANKQLKIHLERLWEHFEIPSWHRELFSARYCTGSYRPEVLLKEAKALASGIAQVQLVMNAISAREAILERLKLLRWGCTNDEFNKPRSTARKHLSEQLDGLRSSTVNVVEALSDWRRSVAPLSCTKLSPPRLPQRPGTDDQVNDETDSSASPGFAEKNFGVVGPGIRGALWPFGDSHADYLLRIVRDDQVIRDFSDVVELSSESDPFLLHGSVGGVGPLESGKLCPPTPDAQDLCRLDQARLRLLEEEMNLTVFGSQAFSKDISPQPVLDLHKSLLSPTKLVQSLTAPLELPPLKSKRCPAEEHFKGRSGSRRRRLRSTRRGASPSPRSRSSAAVKASSSESQEASEEEMPEVITRPKSEVDWLSGRASVASIDRQEATPSTAPSTPGPGRGSFRGLKPLTVASITARSESNPPDLKLPLNSKHGTLLGVPFSSERKQSNFSESAFVSRSVNLEQHSLPSDHHHGSLTEPPSPSSADRLRWEADREASRRPGSIDHARIASAWNRFQHDNMVHHDDVQLALQRIGFIRPNKEWLETAFVQVTMFNGVNRDEFFTVIDNYDALQKKAFEKEFQSFDADSSGHIDIHEFADLLRHLGFEPMHHVLQECIAEVDEDGSECMNFEEFYTVMMLLSMRDGFSKREYESFEEVFQKFDTDGSGEIDARELHSILLYLGCPSTEEEAAEISQKVDVDGSGSIDLQEFIMCMRITRDRELETLKSQIALVPNDKRGNSISRGQILPLLQVCGYHADQDVVKEILHELGRDLQTEDPKGDRYDLSTLWQFLIIYRAREGLSRTEADGVLEAYNHYAKTLDLLEVELDATGEQIAFISASDLPKILRYIGYSLSLEDQKQLTAQVDRDRTGRLRYPELLKLIRFCREKRFREIQEAFSSADPQSGKVRGDNALEAFRRLGCVKNEILLLPPLLATEIVDEETSEIADRPEVGAIEFLAFLRVARFLDEKARKRYRESGGYDAEELQYLRIKFDTFDTDQSGDISSKELIKLVVEVFPAMATDPRQRQHITEIIKEADANGNGKLEFDEFLRFMRAVEDFRHTMQLEKERRVISETKFTGQEVCEFRNIFLAKSKGMSTISLQAFKEILEPICPMGDRNSNLVMKMFAEMAEGESKETGTLDFPDLLQMLRRMLDVDFAGLHQRTKSFGQKPEKYEW